MYRVVNLFLPLFFIIVGCDQQSGLNMDTQIKAEINNFLSDYQRFTNSGQLDSLIVLYSGNDDFQWVEDGRVVYQSTNNIRQALEGLRQSYSLSNLEFSNTKIVPLSSSHSSISTQFQQTLADSAGNGFSFSGAITMIVVMEQGKWNILSGHTSTLKQR